MKKLFKKLFKPVGMALGLAFSFAASAAPTLVAPLLYPLTNGTTFSIVSNGFPVTTFAVSNINSVPFPIVRDRGFVFHINVFTTNASASSNFQATLQFATPHTTNWATGGLVTNWENPITFNFVANLSASVSNNFFSTNVPKTWCDSYTLGRMSSVTNGHASTAFVDPTNTFVSVIP